MSEIQNPQRYDSQPGELPPPPPASQTPKPKRNRVLIIASAIVLIVTGFVALQIFSPNAKKRTLKVAENAAQANPEQVYSDIDKDIQKAVGAPKEELVGLRRETPATPASGSPSPVMEVPPVPPTDRPSSPVYETTPTLAPPNPAAGQSPPSPSAAENRPSGAQRSYYFHRAPLLQPASASSPVMSSPVASSPVASSPVASSPVASSPVASSPVASSVLAKPPFGALLPVRLLGAAASLFPNSLVRLETTRDVSGPGWTTPRGTQFIGRLAQSRANRLSVTVFARLDSTANRLMQIGGEVLGPDASAGLPGERRRVAPRVGALVSRAFSAAVQLTNSFLLGRRGGGGAVVIPQVGDREAADLTGLDLARSPEPAFFIAVPAGAEGYVLVTDLPASETAPDAEPDAALRAALLNEDLRAAALGAAAAETPAALQSLTPGLNPLLRREIIKLLNPDPRNR